ncbi:bacteriohemerythrin [Pseudodesulfovibrio indicus]|uniref:bacteriohemerythrin n=1 Tax=Pseudodesulfovibrio indicus TaxID=1716143 RepID=UPI002930EB8A|nr:bacteriohemerythrin [Pseudodesulfovibrio indicus]
MPFIQWSQKNCIGVPVVDEQHQKLFDILNRLHESVVEGLEQSAVFSILDELIDYTVYHFNTEEEYFEKYGFQGLKVHKEEHDRLTAQALDLQAKLREGSATISFEILDFLHDWLMDHTTGLDMEFGDFIREKGITIG